MLKAFLTFLFAFSVIFFSLTAKESLTINIISRNLQNGAGKEVDVEIIKEELEKLGHKVKLFDYYKVRSISSADINIFLAQARTHWFSKAKLNWFIPNAEFCDVSQKDLPKFDLILCKTQECFKIFKKYSKKVQYIGFTSVDHYLPSIDKDFSICLHVAGKSKMKGTSHVINAWKHHLELPHLILMKQKEAPIEVPKHVTFIHKRLPYAGLLKKQNTSGIHICPSKTEGFGHYLMEAMSVEAVVVTTDAPPMNEFITDKRCLVKCSKGGKQRYGTLYNINREALAETVMALQQLPPEELRKIGQHNREEYLRRSVEFKSEFEKLMLKTAASLANKKTK